jgi:signal transduction histidine kinase/DNA-binding response OmpR family regulator
MPTSDDERAKILVVDDLPEKLMVYQVILNELGQELVCASSGEEALKLVLKHQFAVILLDVNMPGMDGFETASLIRQRRKSAHTPIIFVTAFTDEMRMTEGYAQGAVDYILAPVVPEVLRAKVKVFVDLFQMTQQVQRQAEERIALLEERSRRAALEESNRRLGFSVRAGAVLGQSLDYDVITRDVVRLPVTVLARAVVLAVPESGTSRWQLSGARAIDVGIVQEQYTDLGELDEPIAAAIPRVLHTGVDERFCNGEPCAADAGPNQLVLPLKARGRTFAVLAFTRDASEEGFSSADVTMAEAFASRAAVALENSRLYRDVQHADRQKNEFLSMLAHELRNPLAPIRSAVEVLRLRAQNQPEIAWAQDVIGRQVTHLVRLVDDLLDISRITRGKIRLEMQPVDVGTVLAAAVETSMPLIEASNHHLTVEVSPEPLLVQGDTARLAQVLSNLLNNAAKYTPSGGSIRVSVDREGDQAVFKVRDTGIGIPPEMIGKVFDLFEQVDCSIDRSQGGLGIGLTLVNRLVELHGGTVQAASEGPGKGAEFTVRLPLVAAASTQQPEQARSGDLPLEGAGKTSPSHSLRVLVVDDNVDAADTLADLLRLSGHDVRLAYDGRSAVEAALTFRPTAIVLDLGLPGLNGYEVARHLRDQPATRDAMLIAVSGYGQEEDRRRSTSAGFHKHYVKPLDFQILLSTLAEAAAVRPTQHEPQAASAAGAR